MDPPFSRQLNCRDIWPVQQQFLCGFGAKKDRAKNGVSKRGGGRGEGRKLQPPPPSPPASFIFWLLCHYSWGQNRKSHSLVFVCFVTSGKCLLGTGQLTKPHLNPPLMKIIRRCPLQEALTVFCKSHGQNFYLTFILLSNSISLKRESGGLIFEVPVFNFYKAPSFVQTMAN